MPETFRGIMCKYCGRHLESKELFHQKWAREGKKHKEFMCKCGKVGIVISENIKAISKDTSKGG